MSADEVSRPMPLTRSAGGGAVLRRSSRTGSRADASARGPVPVPSGVRPPATVDVVGLRRVVGAGGSVRLEAALATGSSALPTGCPFAGRAETAGGAAGGAALSLPRVAATDSAGAAMDPVSLSDASAGREPGAGTSHKWAPVAAPSRKAVVHIRRQSGGTASASRVIGWIEETGELRAGASMGSALSEGQLRPTHGVVQGAIHARNKLVTHFSLMN